MNELLGRQIKKMRIDRDFSQEDMAGRLGISRQKYARIESGMNQITLDILSKIAEILDVSVNDITKVLDREPDVSYRGKNEDSSTVEALFDMLDFFYANKHVFLRLQQEPEK